MCALRVALCDPLFSRLSCAGQLTIPTPTPTPTPPASIPEAPALPFSLLLLYVALPLRASLLLRFGPNCILLSCGQRVLLNTETEKGQEGSRHLL